MICRTPHISSANLPEQGTCIVTEEFGPTVMQPFDEQNVMLHALLFEMASGPVCACAAIAATRSMAHTAATPSQL
jgi:hypothetical protein